MQQVYNVEVEIQDRIDVEVSVVGNTIEVDESKPVVNTDSTPLTDQTPLGANYQVKDVDVIDAANTCDVLDKNNADAVLMTILGNEKSFPSGVDYTMMADENSVEIVDTDGTTQEARLYLKAFMRYGFTWQLKLQTNGQSIKNTADSIISSIGASEFAITAVEEAANVLCIGITPNEKVIGDTDLLDSIGNIIGTIVAGVNATAPNGTVNWRLKDSNGVEVDNGAISVRSGQTLSGNITAPDATAVLKDTALATLSTNLIKSGSSLDIEAPDVAITDSEGTPIGFLDALNNYTTTLRSGSTYTMSYADRNVPVDGILVFDRLKLQSPELVLSADKSFTLSGTPVLGSEWIMLIDNTGGHNVTFSADFDVFGTVPDERFTLYMVWHNPSGKVLTYLDQSATVTPPASVILVEDDFSIDPIAANPDRTVVNPSSILSVAAGQLVATSSTSFARNTHYVSYPVYVSTGPMSVASVNVYDTLIGKSHFLSLYKDENNRLQLQDDVGFYRVFLIVGGATVYNFTSAISVSTYPRSKITLDHATKDVKAFYWDGSWIQIGVTHNAAAAPTDVFGKLDASSNTTTAHAMKFDNFSFCDDDYATEFPV